MNKKLETSSALEAFMNNAVERSYLNFDAPLATKDNRELPPGNRLFFKKSLDQND